MSRATVLLFAYCPRRHGMIRERVPAELVEAREVQFRDDGWDVGHLPPGADLKSAEARS
jgi:hypothetical protein